MAAIEQKAAGAGVREPKAPARDARVLVVLHPDSTRFSSEEARAAVDGALRAAGLEHRVFEIPTEGEARPAVVREVARALGSGCDRVIAVGGDGTVSMVAEGLARAGGRKATVALGIVPAGTTNLLARELGIPVSLEAAAAVAAQAEQTITLDAIMIGTRLFLTQVGIGPDARMIRDTSRESQARLGRIAYMANFLRKAFRQRSRRLDLSLDGSPLEARAWQLVVANVGSIGAPPFTWGPRIDPTDGVLNLCLYDVRKPLEQALLVLRLLFVRHRKDESTRFFRVRHKVVIRSDQPLLVQADGEVIGKTPVTVRILPRVLRVLVRREVEKPAEGATAAGSAPSPAGAMTSDVDSMLAEHSRTWVLQGWLRHPVVALQALDAAVFLRVNAFSPGAAVDRAVWLLSSVMRYGEGWAFALFAMIAIDFRTGLRAAVEAVPVIGLTMLTVNYPVKSLFRRRRPFIAFVKARVVGTRPRDFSFPSGHAAAGFAGALVLSVHAPAFAPVFYALAVLVSLSRVYLGVHYPSDVAFGAFLGTAIAAIYRSLFHGLFPGLE